MWFKLISSDSGSSPLLEEPKDFWTHAGCNCIWNQNHFFHLACVLTLQHFIQRKRGRMSCLTLQLHQEWETLEHFFMTVLTCYSDAFIRTCLIQMYSFSSLHFYLDRQIYLLVYKSRNSFLSSRQKHPIIFINWEKKLYKYTLTPRPL